MMVVVVALHWTPLEVGLVWHYHVAHLDAFLASLVFDFGSGFDKLDQVSLVSSFILRFELVDLLVQYGLPHGESLENT